MSLSAWRFCPCCGSPLEWGEVAGQNRQLCFNPPCGFVRWDNPLPVVAAIVQCMDREGRVLIARNQAWPVDKFGLVTGFLERDEAPEAAVAREVREETQLEALAVHLVGVYPFARKNEVLLVYHVPARGEIVLNEELAEYRLVVPEKLRPWPHGTGPALADWLVSLGLRPPEGN